MRMSWNFNIFRKVYVLIFLFLIPVLVLYYYSNQISVEVVEKEINNRNLNKLSYVLSQLESDFEQLSLISLALVQDPDIHKYVNSDVFMKTFEDDYDLVELKVKIMEKISFLSLLNHWRNGIFIYSNNRSEVLSSNILLRGNFTPNEFSPNWEYNPQDDLFYKHTVAPGADPKDDQDNQLIVEVRAPVSYIRQMLEQLKVGGDGDPFLYRPSTPPIVNGTTNEPLVEQLNHRLDQEKLQEAGHITEKINGKKYLITYVHSSVMGWTLADYAKVDSILAPIEMGRNFFWISVGMLLILCFVVALLLFFHVQRPTGELIDSMHRLKKGDYQVRLRPDKNNVFYFIFKRFNEMAAEIQHLIEKAYVEKLRTNEAVMKQLQAQINPHFLYNSLFFIQTMAKGGREEEVEAICMHLSEYYRYATRVDRQTVTLREELSYIRNYLEIHVMRTQRIHYEINVPEDMLEMEIPRMLVQPLVENAIKHGVEPKPGECLIRIGGETANGRHHLYIEDSGVGMSSEKVDHLNGLIRQSANEEDEIGCGVWNIHQRMKFKFGEEAGLVFSSRDEGGLLVGLHWPDDQAEGGERNVQIAVG
ncbi:sensor histidine kinase [Cohnella sp. REN36]|uniref:cache domain-containing sensor histidine kinase n=1 Tax=Cohnella sp. REN36 TaxID=2887347 RepID=UPI001D15099D|nr:sensor histidine kinase [Cohnella sp. REN36]MCC3372076.1 histidine kinase [Cohnella sp. REN36]